LPASRRFIHSYEYSFRIENERLQIIRIFLFWFPPIDTAEFCMPL
jgi:hypothetical protein